MAAFDEINSGIPSMDAALHHIRIGDNVVFQVPDLQAFQAFTLPFVNQAVSEKRRVVYVRFASHPPLLEPQPGVEILHLPLSHHFETFTVAVHDSIAQNGRETFYVFDSLSELQTIWATDMMMANFFRLTCPYLFQMDTVAYFPLLRGRHSFSAIARIRETTQLLLDVYNDGQGNFYVHPLKVWNRYGPRMFLPHLYCPQKDAFAPLTDGVRVSRFYACLSTEESQFETQDEDSWDRFFSKAKTAYQAGTLSPAYPTIMCRRMMTRDQRLQELILDTFEPSDYFAVRSRMIGTGMIGGKACGMLLARKILRLKLPELQAHLEPHDSFFIGSDVFYTYIVENGLWDLRVLQRTEAGYTAMAPDLKRALAQGVFPGDIQEQFKRMLDYFGASPIIVRSSSILEDGFGNAFAGKYDSVFCVNTGDPETRLARFEDAVRKVYASSMNAGALAYRKRRGMDKNDEQMALLVQRVSGSFHDFCFMPDGAGVGYSLCAYPFTPGMDPAAGMLRLVMGLGTRAVDRTEGDYPRLVSLSNPSLQTVSTPAEAHRYSQHNVDTLDTENGRFCSYPFDGPVAAPGSPTARGALYPLLSPPVTRAFLSHDTDAETLFRERGEHRQIVYISCKGLTQNNTFITMMRNMLAVLQEAYRYPVDIEYTVNLGDDGDFMVNLLQCRPLQGIDETEVVTVPACPEVSTYFHTQGASMGRSRKQRIDAVVVIDPKGYYTTDYHLKPAVGQAIGLLNSRLGEHSKHLVLICPGRIGTSSPELGVPVTYSDISNFDTIAEVAYSQAGYRPELSYGSHMFQDLVESDVLYCALFENDKTLTFRPQWLAALGPDRFETLCPEHPELAGLAHVYDTAASGLTLWHDARSNETFIGLPPKTS